MALPKTVQLGQVALNLSGQFFDLRRTLSLEATFQLLMAFLKIRFEVYESDFLLTGGLDDHMGTFSSDAGYGDKPEVRPLILKENAAKLLRLT